ncbi:uncharacterized protein SRT_20280 [Streptococcus troglodytae]|uniref:Lipoprotein n=1 Tax=Streptococcus troglodytae TaxID=1111760 RepID=A0A1L7LM93_9STRE|nr:uncharacterized protein SRT_20280 [Streptococcus troglodytae]
MKGPSKMLMIIVSILAVGLLGCLITWGAVHISLTEIPFILLFISHFKRH